MFQGQVVQTFLVQALCELVSSCCNRLAKWDQLSVCLPLMSSTSKWCWKHRMFDESKEKVQHGPMEDKDSSLPSNNVDFNVKRNTFANFLQCVRFHIFALQWISSQEVDLTEERHCTVQRTQLWVAIAQFAVHCTILWKAKESSFDVHEVYQRRLWYILLLLSAWTAMIGIVKVWPWRPSSPFQCLHAATRRADLKTARQIGGKLQ